MIQTEFVKYLTADIFFFLTRNFGDTSFHVYICSIKSAFKNNCGRTQHIKLKTGIHYHKSNTFRHTFYFFLHVCPWFFDYYQSVIHNFKPTTSGCVFYLGNYLMEIAFAYFSIFITTISTCACRSRRLFWR